MLTIGGAMISACTFLSIERNLCLHGYVCLFSQDAKIINFEKTVFSRCYKPCDNDIPVWSFKPMPDSFNAMEELIRNISSSSALG
jgi:hypothetical protein